MVKRLIMERYIYFSLLYLIRFSNGIESWRKKRNMLNLYGIRFFLKRKYLLLFFGVVIFYFYILYKIESYI